MTIHEIPTSRAALTAIGTYVPERVMTNADFEAIIETSDAWIVQRTGIRERRIAAPDEFTTDLCVRAVQDLQARFDVSLADVDLILVATTTPDYAFPSVASQVQARLGIPHAGAIDLQAACAGFVYGLQLANAMITAGGHRKVLVIGGETLSKVTDYTDRTTCILFGDGAGAVLVERADEGAFLAVHNGSEGSGGEHLYRQGLSKEMNGSALQGDGFMVQNGREVYKWAVSTLAREIPAWLTAQGQTLSEIDWFVPHSANLRILEAVNSRLDYPMERTLFSGELYGNTSAATIPLALDLALRDGHLQAGQTLLLYGFGGGLVHAGAVVRWTIS
jgi:3-oxoacyl-[acyl-carrier-protein] synthase-3